MTRGEAIERLSIHKSTDVWIDSIAEAIDMAIEALKDKPKGEWTEVDSWESEKHSVTDMRCSICGKYASIVLSHRTRCVYSYCPNCGAKMDGERSEE